MSCNACTRRYGFFCKETGCPNCGYSFCTKCLRKMIEVPRCNNDKLKVCPKCFEKLEKEKNSSNQDKTTLGQQSKIEANEVFAINETIENLAPPLEPISPAREVTPDDDNELADNLDSVIMKKLENLKKCEDENALNDNDITSRINALKGLPYKEYTKSDISLLSGPPKTNQEQINDLIKQFIEEKNIDDEVKNDQTIDPIADIERRLAILKGNDPNAETSKTKPVEKEEDEENEIKKVMEKYLEETKLPDFAITDEEKELIEGLPKPSKNTEELPWCTICNEDAVIRCIGCDGDLFCNTCFRECHDDEEYREHQTKPYESKKNFNENHF